MIHSKLKMGMVGCGRNVFIYTTYRRVVFMDNYIKYVCKCFRLNHEISRSSGYEYFLSNNRVYDSSHEMFKKKDAITIR
jgi:hypothetical protein